MKSLIVEGIPALITFLFLIFLFFVIIWVVSKFLTYIIIGLGVLILLLILAYIVVKII